MQRQTHFTKLSFINPTSSKTTMVPVDSGLVCAVHIIAAIQLIRDFVEIIYHIFHLIIIALDFRTYVWYVKYTKCEHQPNPLTPG